MTAMSVRLPDALAEQLRDAARDEGQSMNQAVVVAIQDWLRRRDTKAVTATADEIAKRHASLLERLANS